MRVWPCKAQSNMARSDLGLNLTQLISTWVAWLVTGFCFGRPGKNRNPKDKPWIAGEPATCVAYSLIAHGKNTHLHLLNFQESLLKGSF